MRSPVVWLLTSPLRFAAGVLAIVTAIVTIALLMSLGDGVGGSTTTPDRRSTGGGGLISASPPSSDHDHVHDVPANAKAARKVLDEFLAGYLAPTSHEDVERVRDRMTGPLWQGLAISDPSRHPTGPVEDVETRAKGAFAVIYAVRLPAQSIVVDVVRAPGGWRVSSVQPADS